MEGEESSGCLSKVPFVGWWDGAELPVCGNRPEFVELLAGNGVSVDIDMEDAAGMGDVIEVCTVS